MRKKKLTLVGLKKMKKKGKPVAWITAYDLPFAYTAEQAGIDMILVGDSGGMVQLGYETTNPVTMDEMITMAKSVRKGAPNTFVIGDMPQGSYEISNEKAVENAMRFVKEAGCDAIKLEGGRRVTDRVDAIVRAGIPVMGHLGLTPQSATSFGGYRVQGKTIESFDDTIEDSLALSLNGVFAILLEAMPNQSASQITKAVSKEYGNSVSMFGIGAGVGVDGQLVIMHDIMGFYQPFRPWFAKCYIPEVIEEYSEYIARLSNVKEHGRESRNDGLLILAKMAIERYIEEVKKKEFPSDEYSYEISKEDISKLQMSNWWTV